MHRFNKTFFVVAISAVLSISGAILFAETYLTPVVSTGAETVDGTIINVGQSIIGRADDGRNVFAHMGVIPIYVASIPSILGDCTGDGVVDLDDYAQFSECMAGPENGLLKGCECADLDHNLHVDLRDVAIHAVQFGTGF